LGFTNHPLILLLQDNYPPSVHLRGTTLLVPDFLLHPHNLSIQTNEFNEVNHSPLVITLASGVVIFPVRLVHLDIAAIHCLKNRYRLPSARHIIKPAVIQDIMLRPLLNRRSPKKSMNMTPPYANALPRQALSIA